MLYFVVRVILVDPSPEAAGEGMVGRKGEESGSVGLCTDVT